MKNLLFLAFIFAIITLTSCNKDDDNNNGNPEPYQPKGYIQLTVGNYWIYQHYRVRADGTDTIISLIDSVYISGTKEYNNETFYKIETQNWIPQTLYLRDSLGNLIDTLGHIHMSETNFSDTIGSSTETLSTGIKLFHIASIMYDEDKNIETPIDNFTHCIERRNYIKVYYENPIPKEYIDNEYYAQGVGIAQSSYTYVSSGQQFRRKLIRYNVILIIE